MTPSSSPLAGLDFALVGPGKVGASLASWAIARGARLVSVSGRSGSTSARELARRHAAAHLDASELVGNDTHLALLAVPDAQLPGVVRRLAGRRTTRGIALHVSGAHGASVLSPLCDSGWRVGSFHPLRAFPTIEPDIAGAAGVFFALDGDAEARAMGRRLAEAFGGTSGIVEDADRALYHWAATVAAGGVTTLYATAIEVGRRLGLPPEALHGFGKLAQGALAAALDAPEPALAITGPAARGDAETIESHLAALSERAPDLEPLAIELARATLARRSEIEPPDGPRRALAERLGRSDLLDRSKDRVLTSSRPRSA